MAAELKLTKITPTTGTSIDVEGNLTIGTDAVPRALEVKGNLTVGVDVIAGGDLDMGGTIVADSITVRDTPSASNELATIGYITNNMTLENYITGFEISNNGSDSDHDIDIAAGLCRDSTNIITISTSTGFTKQLDAAWVAGTNQGGLDTGTVANDTWYYLFAIYSTSTGSTDVLFSTSPTSPTMPSGYDYKRRIRGAVLTDGSANIVGFFQKDSHFTFASQIQDAVSNGAGTNRILLTVSVPPNMIGKIGLRFYYTNVAYAYIQQTNETDTIPSISFHDVYVDAGGFNNAIFKLLEVNASSQIALRTDVSASTSYIHTYGFIDPAQS